jgi:sulfate adenylyltransferase subunit 2
MADHLDELENNSVFIIREAYRKMKNLTLLWSMGKDSTVMLHLVKKAFLGHVPISLLHIDTTYKIPEMITWRDDYVRRHGLRLLVGKNEQALADGMNPERGRLNCCGALKTEALLDAVKQHKIQGLLVGIRGDEEGSRGKERVASPRTTGGDWTYKDQPAEVWRYYNLHVPENVHVRVHPILHWTELDIWKYIERENLELIPLYLSREGRRYRSIGCYPCTSSIESNACSLPEIISELQACKTTERAGRMQDKVDAYAMQKLRKEGYM